MNKEYPIVRIDEFSYLDSNYVAGDKKYEVLDLIKASEKLETFDLPLAAICLDHKLLNNTGDLRSFIYHSKRVEKSDLSYPVIIDAMGYICDGWHRVAKAILLGHTSIKAKRLIVMPEYTIIKD